MEESGYIPVFPLVFPCGPPQPPSPHPIPSNLSPQPSPSQQHKPHYVLHDVLYEQVIRVLADESAQKVMPATASSFAASTHSRAFLFGGLAALLVGVVALARYGGALRRGSGGTKLKLEDVYTEDRCVVYTFYNPMGGGDDQADIEVWRNSWSNAGWKPVVSAISFL